MPFRPVGIPLLSAPYCFFYARFPSGVLQIDAATREEWRASGRAGELDAYRISRATELGARAASTFSGISGISCYVTQHPLQKAIHLTVRERDIFWAHIFLILNQMDYTFLSRYLAPVNESVSASKYPRLLASSSLCHVTSLKVKMAVAAAVAPLVYLPMPTDELWGTKESMEGRISLSTALLASARIWRDRLRQQWGRRARAQDEREDEKPTANRSI